MKIWKYTLVRDVHSNEILMARGARVVHVGMQGLHVCLWVELNSEEPAELRVFSVVATGEDYHGAAQYIGTTQDGPFVWHVIERTRRAIEGGRLARGV